MMKSVALVVLLAQVAFSAPNVENGRTLKEAAQLGTNIVLTTGEVYSKVFDGAAKVVETLETGANEGVKAVQTVQGATNDVLLKILDLNIEFILCKILSVCKNADVRARLNIDDGLSIEQLNSAIEELATDETIENERTLYILNSDYQTYLTNRVKALLCANGEPQFCTNIEEVVAVPADETDENARFFFKNKPTDPSKPTPTVATAVHKLFDHLTTKIAFVVCKLRLWCPDHDKAFATVTMAAQPGTEPPAPEVLPPAPEVAPPAPEVLPPAPEVAPPAPEAAPPAPEVAPPAPEVA